GGFLESLLEGMVWSIEAAAADALGSDALPRYTARAVEAYQTAFAIFDHPGLGQAIVERVVDDLRGRTPTQQLRRAEIRILLALDRTTAETVKLAVELVKGGNGLLVPDPIALGLTAIDLSFLESFRDAWQFVIERWPCPVG